jgi:hypothetical protein
MRICSYSERHLTHRYVAIGTEMQQLTRLLIAQSGNFSPGRVISFDTRSVYVPMRGICKFLVWQSHDHSWNDKNHFFGHEIGTSFQNTEQFHCARHEKKVNIGYKAIAWSRRHSPITVPRMTSDVRHRLLPSNTSMTAEQRKAWIRLHQWK